MFRFALTIFVSAFLLFQIQPLIGRFILPWFGGGPSIWTTCMLFFQLVLLGGYVYAHFTSVLLKPKTQVIVHLVLLVASLAFLPIAPGQDWKPQADDSPMLHILLLLLATVGGPYFILSSTGPLMQKWFSSAEPGKSPWRLYALSNIGSLLALLSYPFAFEPWLTLRQQVWSWSGVYIAYVAGVVWCAVAFLRSHQTSTATVDSTELAATAIQPPGCVRMVMWTVLAASGSVMLLATTNQLCIDVATVPFLWVLPLSLYLISFIICFDSPRWYDRRVFGLLLLFCAPVACWVINEGADVSISKQVLIYSTVLFACCMTCHGELVSLKPDTKYLTLFYLLVSAGGAIGGLLVALVAPRIFHGYWEYHLGLVICFLATMAAWCVQRVWQRRASVEFWTCAVVVALHIFFIAHPLYVKLDGIIESTEESILFGVYGFLQVLILLVTGVLAHRLTVLHVLWIAHFLLTSAWIYGFSAWKFPAQMDSEAIARLIAGAVISPVVAVFVPWLVRRLNSISKMLLAAGTVSCIAGVLCGWLVYREWTQPMAWDNEAQQWMYLGLMGLGLVWPAMWFGRLWLLKSDAGSLVQFPVILSSYPVWCAVSGFLVVQGYVNGWQVVSLISTVVAAIMMEWSSRGFLGTDRPSLGFWFWVPAGTLLLMFSNQLMQIVASDSQPTEYSKPVHTARNFYGVLRVSYEAADESDEMPGKYSLTHGQIKHGFQFDDDYWGRQPTTYYGRDSGVGLAIELSRRWADESDQHPVRVGVVGLGTGTLAAYGAAGEYFRFYDINPEVKSVATTYFTYLSESEAKTDVVIGDARIVMERELAANQSQQFDVLAIDAFSSDAIPVHLLTSECGQIYRQHLRRGGILAVHISNRFLDLNPVTRGMAERLGWHAVRIENDNNDLTGVFSSTWILLSERPDLRDDPDIQHMEAPWEETDRILHWTDDYSGLWQVLSL
jgi:hypothetical protein